MDLVMGVVDDDPGQIALLAAEAVPNDFASGFASTRPGRRDAGRTLLHRQGYDGAANAWTGQQRRASRRPRFINSNVVPRPTARRDSRGGPEDIRPPPYKPSIIVGRVNNSGLAVDPLYAIPTACLANDVCRISASLAWVMSGHLS